MNILLKYVQVFRKAKPYSLYILILLYITYMINQLDRYALSITSVETAQELKYGDKSCLKLANTTKAVGEECTKANQTTYLIQFKLDFYFSKFYLALTISCEQIYQNTTNGTLQKACKYDYNGQGIEYQVYMI